MKNLKIKPGAFQIDELKEKVRSHFGLAYIVTDNGRNEIVIAKNKTIGCRLIITNKRLMISGTFATMGKLILAMVIGFVGLVIIPMAIYMIVYKSKFEAIEKEVHGYILSEFPDRLI
jgi:hypothetical protein